MLRQKTRRKTTSLRTLRTNAYKTFTLGKPTEPHPGFVKKKKKVAKKAHNKQPNTHNSANKTAALITAA